MFFLLFNDFEDFNFLRIKIQSIHFETVIKNKNKLDKKISLKIVSSFFYESKRESLGVASLSQLQTQQVAELVQLELLIQKKKNEFLKTSI